jgi:hypothetical protein
MVPPMSAKVPASLVRVWLRGSELGSTGPLPGLDARDPSEVTILLPWTDRAQADAASALMLRRAGADCQVLCLEDDARSGPMALMNQVLTRLSADWVVYAAQDAFAGRGWLQYALQGVSTNPKAQLLAFNDGKWFGQLAAFGMVQRKWALSLYGSSLFHPGYRHHYGDVELTLVARQQQALAYHPHALLVEVDPQKDGRPVNEADRARFLSRAAEGFEGRVVDPALLKQFG